MTQHISLAETAHAIIREHLREGMAAIDATLGNGHDALFLAQCVGTTGHVYGFDIQAQALQFTRLRLQQYGVHVQASLFLASHADMLIHVPQSQQGRIQAVMFNLGYLPGADKSVITRPDTTLTALNSACSLLAVRGLLTVTAYPGHVGGDDETERVECWLQELDPVLYEHRIIFSHYHQETAPRLFVVRKLA